MFKNDTIKKEQASQRVPASDSPALVWKLVYLPALIAASVCS
jgi:hypothetical protein